MVSSSRVKLRLVDYGDPDCWGVHPCSDCGTLKPDASQAHNGTWHDTSSNICGSMDAASAIAADHSVSFVFTGKLVGQVVQGPNTSF